MNRFARVAPAALLALSLSSCSDGTGPGDLDPDAIHARLTNLMGTFENNAAFNSLLTMSSFFPCYTPVCAAPLMEAAQLPRTLAMAARGSVLEGRVGNLRRLVTPARQMSLLSDIQALFPANVLGKTLEWSTQTNEYVIGSGTGAPANGVRVLLYVVNQVGPVVPLQQLGYVDFTDQSTAQYDRLGVMLRLGGTTIADYHITQTETTTPTPLTTLRAVGRLNTVDLTEHADFDITAAGDDQDLFTLTEEITGSDGTVLSVSLGGNAANSTIEVGIGSAGAELEFEMHEASDIITGEARFNGATIAHITGDANTPLAFTAAEGVDLSDDELDTLGLIFGVTTLFAVILTFGILGPAAIVF